MQILKASRKREKKIRLTSDFSIAILMKKKRE